MSPSKLNSLLTGVFVAMCFVAMYIAVSGSVMAQDGLRLWKPYDPQLFSGGRRSNDGMYSSLSGIYWTISAPEGGYIGATTDNGKDDTRWVYDVRTSDLRIQTNSVKINMMSPTMTLGTRFEVGNRRGHHGWLVSGYGLPGQSHRITASDVSMAIRDPDTIPGTDYGYLWGNNYTTIRGTRAEAQLEATGTAGWLPVPYPSILVQESFVDDEDGQTYYYWPDNIPPGTVYYLPIMGDVTTPGIFERLPVAFEDITVRVRSQHMSAEAMYTYRAHPFTWGSMELLAGARYWDFDDRFGLDAGNTSSTSAVGSATANTGAISAFEFISVNAKAQNRVVGPQVGMKLNRQNARWTFGAEGRLTGGINAQTVKTEGHITPHKNYTPVGLQGLYSNDPGRYQQNSFNQNFGHKQTRAYFSPVVEFRLSTEWQWTQAVSFFGAAEAMWAGNIARGVRVTDYVVRSDGTIFGIRGNDRNTSIAVYGVEAGIKVNR